MTGMHSFKYLYFSWTLFPVECLVTLVIAMISQNKRTKKKSLMQVEFILYLNCFKVKKDSDLHF